MLIHNIDDLERVLRRNVMQMKTKLEIIKYVWGVALDWSVDLDSNPYFQNLEKMIKHYNQKFIDDVYRFGKAARDYDFYFAAELERLRLDKHTSSAVA